MFVTIMYVYYLHLFVIIMNHKNQILMCYNFIFITTPFTAQVLDEDALIY